MSKVRPKQGKKVEVQAVADLFPFPKYFSNAPQPVFKGRSYEEDMDIAEGCYRHIKKIFTQLEVRMFDTHIHIALVPSLAIQHSEDISRLPHQGRRGIFIYSHHVKAVGFNVVYINIYKAGNEMCRNYVTFNNISSESKNLYTITNITTFKQILLMFHGFVSLL